MAKGAKGGNIYGKGGGNQAELTYAPNKGTALLNDPNSAAQSTNGSLIPFSDEPMPNYYRQRIDINAPTKNLNKEYGREQDYIEFHVYDIDDNLLSSDYNFKNVSFGDLSTNTNLYSSLEFNSQFVLNSKGFYTGQYRIVMNIQRKKNNR